MLEVRQESDTAVDGAMPARGPSRLEARRGSAVSFSHQQQQLALNQPIRKTSRLELVEGPAGVQLQEVQEDEQSATSRKGTLNNIGQIPTQLNKRKIDKHIKTEVAHHSAAVEDTGSTVEREAVSRGVRIPRNSVTAFIFQHLHLAVASPAIFRIPFLVDKHSTYSGSAFLLVYVIALFVVGVPLYVLEVTMAQYSSLGPIHIYRCLPLFTGVGVGMLVACFLTTLYCSTVISWILIYVLQSFYNPLPWKSCPSDAAAMSVCVNASKPTPLSTNITRELFNITDTPRNTTYVPADYYFRTVVTHSLFNEESAVFGIELPFLMLFVWSVVFVCILSRRDWHSGITSWIIGISVYVMLILFFLEGLRSDSSDLGIHRAFGLNFTAVSDELENPTIWVDALGQVLWSLGIAIALLIMSASHNMYTDSIILNSTAAILANLTASLLVVLAFFPFVGEMRTLGTEIVANPGFSLVISSFAVTYLTIPQLASFVFYCSFALTLTYHMVTLADTVLSSIAEVLYISWRRGFRRVVLAGMVCVVGFFCSVWFSSSDGIYLISCLDGYLPWISGTVFALLETIAFVHCFGAKKILLQMKDMSQAKTSFASYWKFILPPVLLGLQLWGYIEGVHDPLDWMLTPTGRENLHLAVGLTLSIVPVVVCIVATCGIVYKSRDDHTRLGKPQESWGPALLQHRKLYTQDVLRAAQRTPWLVMQSEGDLVSESCRNGWIPTGYSYIPEGSAAYVLMSSDLLDEVDDAGRRIIVSNFLRQREKLQRQQSEKQALDACGCCECHARRKSSSKKKRLRKKWADVDPNRISENETLERRSERRNDKLGVRRSSEELRSTGSDDSGSTLQVPELNAGRKEGRRSGATTPTHEIILIPNGLGEN